MQQPRPRLDTPSRANSEQQVGAHRSGSPQVGGFSAADETGPVAPITLRVLLGLPEIRSGAPEVLSGAEDLDVPVRWVHIADSERVGSLLEGRELVLSTGQSFRGSLTATERFLDELEAAGAAGAVVELVDEKGLPATEAIEILREATRMRALPVVLLVCPIRFVRVTQVAHRMLVGEQLARVERARHVHEVFTQLSLESASEQQIVDRTAELLAAPVVLEDAAHRVLAFHPGGTPPSSLLLDWTERARRVGYQEQTGRRTGEEDWLQTPVGVRGRRWGRLIVPSALPDDAEAAPVLERAGQALTLTRMAGRDERELLHQAQAGLMHELRQPRVLTAVEAATRSAALGLEPSAFYLPLVLRLDRLADEDPTGLQLRERALLEDLTVLARQARRSMLAASMRSGSLGVLVAVPARELADALTERICAGLADLHGPEISWTIGVSRPKDSLLQAAASLDEAAQVADIAATLEIRQRPYYRFADVRLRGLLSLLKEDSRVKAFAQAELAPLLQSQDPEALELLELYLRHGGNKSALARTGYLSRPALYHRLARLQEKLGVSLDDAESRTSLHVALLWYRLAATNPYSTR
jgi:purine catabolism regulator